MTRGAPAPIVAAVPPNGTVVSFRIFIAVILTNFACTSPVAAVDVQSSRACPGALNLRASVSRTDCAEPPPVPVPGGERVTTSTAEPSASLQVATRFVSPYAPASS
jgi:hypothetical protein